MDQETIVEKIKPNFEPNLLILLINGNKLSVFRSRKLIKTFELTTKSDIGHKFLFINEESRFKNQDAINFPKETFVKTLVLFDLLNFDLVEVNMSKLKNIHSTTTKLKDNNKTDLNTLVIVHRELNIIFFIEKSLKKFSFVSYKKNFGKNSNESSIIRYLNYQDEKVTQQFWSTFLGYPNFKYKVLKIKNLEFYFSISILKRENENDPKSPIKKVHSTLIVYARIVKSSNRNDSSIEIEIVQVYPFCKRFHFFEDENNSKDMILCAYFTNPLISAYVSNDGKLSMININQNKEIFNIDLIFLSNSKIMNLCVDSNIEYLVFNDSNKLLWLFRIKDSKQLACLPLYGFVNQIKFSSDNKYVCLNMNDRRIFNLLIVDPDCEIHKNRIKELNSRKVLGNSIKDGQVDTKNPAQIKSTKNKKMYLDDEQMELEVDFEMLAEDEDVDSSEDLEFSSDDSDESEETGSKDKKSIGQKESNMF